jgi:hypothetical protein
LTAEAAARMAGRHVGQKPSDLLCLSRLRERRLGRRADGR